MIKVRSEDNSILVWNRNLGRTALISGAEMETLHNWCSMQLDNSVSVPGRGFIRRLESLGFLPKITSEKSSWREVYEAYVQAIEGVSGGKAPLRSLRTPESLHIELTERCPLNCPQCYKSGKSIGDLRLESTSSEETEGRDLTRERLMGLINEADKLKVFQIALGGGEPLLYPDLEYAVREISRHGISSSITTSGVLLDKDRLTALISAGLNHVQISLNGSSAEIHNRSRDGFDKGIEALNLLSETTKCGDSISYGINWVARKDNISDLTAMLQLVKASGASNINILRYKPSGGENYSQSKPSSSQLLQLADTINEFRENEMKRGKEYEKDGEKRNVLSIKTDSAFSNLLCHINGRHSALSGCGAGRRFLAVDAEGRFHPCSHLTFLSEEDSCDPENVSGIFDYWNNSKRLAAFRQIEDKISTPCLNCRYMTGCRGCRATVLNENHNQSFYQGENHCPFYSF